MTEINQSKTWIITRWPAKLGANQQPYWTLEGPSWPRGRNRIEASVGRWLTATAPAEFRHDWHGITTWHLPYDLGDAEAAQQRGG